MIIFADLHLREETEDTVFNAVLPGLIDGAGSRGDKVIACLGDLFHFRYKIAARLQNKLYDWFTQHEDYQFKILPGNHDQYDINGRNALEVFNSLDNVQVFTQATVDKDGLWIPYRKDNTDVEELIAKNLKKTKTAFMHHGIQGAAMNDCIQDTDGLPPAMFQQFKTVLLGHYHKRQTIGNCHYIGSPYQIKSDEAGQAKGFAIWDGKKLEYVDRDWGIKYHRVTVNSLNELNLDQFGKDDEIRIKAGPGVDPAKLGKKLAKAGFQHHTVTPEVEPLQVRLNVAPDSNITNYAQAYVQQTETPLDKDRLLEIFHRELM